MLLFSLCLAGPADPVDPEPWVEASYVIVASKTDYASAMKVAVEVADAAKLPLHLRVGYDPRHKDVFGGLTYAYDACEGEGYPCYYTRGRIEGHSNFVSIEWSDSVRGFKSGLYVVVAGIGNADEMKKVLAAVKPTVPDAYMKKGEVYVGCMH